MIETEVQSGVRPTSDECQVCALVGLYRISRTLAGTGTQRQMLRDVLDILDSELGMNRGAIMLVSPDHRELMIEAAHHVAERHRKAVRYRMGEGITGRVVETGKPMAVPKVSKEPMFLDRLHRRPCHDQR